MFEGVVGKLERAEYFLQHLKDLKEEYGSLACVGLRQQEMRATLDGFFFEIVSAEDFFISGIIDLYKLQLPQDIKVTQRKRLIKELKAQQLGDVAGVIERIDQLLDASKLRPENKLQDDEESWLWKLNNYRNSATHRELLRTALVPSSGGVKTYLFKDPEDESQGNADIEVIPYCEQSLNKMKKFLEDLYSDLKI